MIAASHNIYNIYLSLKPAILSFFEIDGQLATSV